MNGKSLLTCWPNTTNKSNPILDTTLIWKICWGWSSVKKKKKNLNNKTGILDEGKRKTWKRQCLCNLQMKQHAIVVKPAHSQAEDCSSVTTCDCVFVVFHSVSNCMTLSWLSHYFSSTAASQHMWLCVSRQLNTTLLSNIVNSIIPFTELFIFFLPQGFRLYFC